MMTLDATDPPLLRVTVSGEVRRDEVRGFYREFEPSLERAGRAGVLVDMTGFTDIGAGALLEDVIHEIGLLDDLSRMPRCAVVTGNRTLAGLVRYVAPLVPRMQMRAYPPEEAAQAEAWCRGAGTA